MLGDPAITTSPMDSSSVEGNIDLSDSFNQYDLEKLRAAIRTMSVRSQLYKLLKEELGLRGWWKNRSRGKHNPGKMNGKATS